MTTCCQVLGAIMSDVVEFARFKVATESESDFLAARPAMVAAVLERVPGLRDISLIRLDDGTWVDLVIWSSRDAADQGAKIAASLPEARRWLGHVSQDVSMDLGEVIDRAGAAVHTFPSAADVHTSTTPPTSPTPTFAPGPSTWSAGTTERRAE
jgi:heme-degrading monooxygenase HmoA